MRELFDQTTLNGMKLANRFVRSATWEGVVRTDGFVTQELIDMMVALAKGGVGMIITGHAYVRPDGQANPRQLGIYRNKLIPGLKELTDAVHAAGGKIVIQLSHGGKYAAEELTGEKTLVVSLDDMTEESYREITKQDIGDIVTSFAEAAARAKTAGFDGVQIHAAHGYLLSQFLSPGLNRRQDEYGGSIENRSRICLEIINAVRQTVGKYYPILVKLNSEDSSENGLKLDESVQVARMMADSGIDALELSGGIINTNQHGPSKNRINSVAKEAYFREAARSFRREIGIPLILVGGIRSFEVAEELVANDEVDYISMSRPFIMEPSLIMRWKSGDHSIAQCKSDNLCLKSGRAGTGVRCLVKEKL